VNRRTLVVLVAALAILAVVAALVLRGAETGTRERGLLLPGLKEQLNGIQRIVVTGPGNAAIATLERGTENWTVVERSNYAADVGRIRQNLLALAEARIVEEKTSNPDFYDRLGVQDVSAATAKGVLLTLTGGKKPVSVIIGQAPSGSTNQTYARRAGEPMSWLVTGQFDLGKTGGEWLDRSLTDIPAGRIQSVTITHPGLETLRISRDPKTDKSTANEGMVEFLVADVPAERELSYPGVANGVAGVLAELELDDAQTREVLGANPGKPVVARFVTTDGLAVETSAWRLPDGTRFTFIASGDGDAAKEAAAINARLGGWVYTVPSYKAEQLTRRLQELLAGR
jgi:hypothetical protein